MALIKLNPEEWINKYMGKIFDIDKVYDIQCVDLFKLLLRDVGFPDPTQDLGGTGFADEIWYQRDKYKDYFTFHTGELQMGDIVLWQKGSKECPSSHVAMFYKDDPDPSRGIFFGSNQEYANSPGVLTSISTAGTLGHLRYKGWTNNTSEITLIPEHRIARVKEGHNINIRKGSPDGTVVRTAPTGTKVEYTEKCVTNGHRYVSWIENGTRLFMAVTPTEEQANHWVDILPVPTKPSTSTSLPETTVTPSTPNGFIEAIAKAVQYYAPKYDIKVCSPIIAQAILESAWGTSTKAKHHNYFGLKYREGRLTCNSGTFVDGSQEQLANGQYIPITAQWYEFKTLESGVEGYFQFINIANYSSLKGETDPHKYLEKIKAAGYATSQKYVDNVWNVVTANNLTRFDNQTETKKEEAPSMTLKTSQRFVAVDTMGRPGTKRSGLLGVTIHNTGNYSAGAGAASHASYVARSCYSVFDSYHWVVDDKEAIQLIPEDEVSWHAGDGATGNGNTKTISIEICVNSDGDLRKATDNAVELSAQILKRHGLNANNLYQHADFMRKNCPSEIRAGRPYDWATFKSKVAAKLKGQNTTNTVPSKPSTSSNTLYRVRKSWSDAKSQIGAYSVLDNAKKACPKGYSVYDSNGKVVYSNVETWDINGKVLPGSIVKSKSLAIKGVVGEDAIVPELVPLKPYRFPMIMLSEASDSKDGAVDNYLATTDARVYLDPVEVTEIDIPNNRCKVKGSNVWISSVPLYVKK